MPERQQKASTAGQEYTQRVVIKRENNKRSMPDNNQSANME
jgi:hypothetical protein